MCFSLNWMLCAHRFWSLVKLNIRKFSDLSITKNSHNRVMNLRPASILALLAWLLSSLKCNEHHLIYTIGYLQTLYQTVIGAVKSLWNTLYNVSIDE